MWPLNMPVLSGRDLTTAVQAAAVQVVAQAADPAALVEAAVVAVVVAVAGPEGQVVPNKLV